MQVREVLIRARKEPTGNTYTYMHINKKDSLCREQSIRGYVSKVKRILYVYFLPYLHNHEYFALDRVLLVSVGVC